jgi:hypothetical protein
MTEARSPYMGSVHKGFAVPNAGLIRFRLLACLADRTATGVVQVDGRRTIGFCVIAANPLDEPNIQTHQEELDRAALDNGSEGCGFEPQRSRRSKSSLIRSAEYYSHPARRGTLPQAVLCC